MDKPLTLDQLEKVFHYEVETAQVGGTFEFRTRADTKLIGYSVSKDQPDTVVLLFGREEFTPDSQSRVDREIAEHQHTHHGQPAAEGDSPISLLAALRDIDVDADDYEEDDDGAHTEG